MKANPEDDTVVFSRDLTHSLGKSAFINHIEFDSLMLMPISVLFHNNRHGNGGYCTFTAKIIIDMIIPNTAKSSFFAICTMLTFHKHLPPFIDSGYKSL